MNIHNHMSNFYKFALSVVPDVAGGLIVFLLLWLTAVIVKALITRIANHSKKRKYLLLLLGKTAKISIILIGAISALGTMGVNITALVTSLGLVGFALGFALKDFLSNIIAGFMILFYHPFQVNDFITVSSISGTVVSINLRYTIIHNDDESHTIPNAKLLTSVVSIKHPAIPKTVKF